MAAAAAGKRLALVWQRASREKQRLYAVRTGTIDSRRALAGPDFCIKNVVVNSRSDNVSTNTSHGALMKMGRRIVASGIQLYRHDVMSRASIDRVLALTRFRKSGFASMA